MFLQNTSIQNNIDTLSVSDISNEKIYMFFLYIGTDETVYAQLNKQFESGHQESSLSDANIYLNSINIFQKNHRLPDVIFVDLPFNEPDLRHFHSSLKTKTLISNLPVIYNERQLSESQLKKLHHLNLIDDIARIGSGKIDYFSKIMFLKESKLHNQSFALKTSYKIQKKNVSKGLSHVAKRGIDITAASLGILLLSPVLLLFAIAIKLESKGPVFYISLRAGKGFKVFKFYKFRSMAVNADKELDKLSHLNQYTSGAEGPSFFKIDNDPRITRLGKILRNTSMDELPQLFNVLIGDMSLVGNRPLPLYEANTLTTNEFVERFSAPAGITGLWQVNKRGKADMSIEERINLDIAYSRNFNFFYDLKIMVKTPVALFQKSDV